MFTGIIEDIGKVVKFENQKLTFLTKLDDFIIGDSIAVNGICLTIVKNEKLKLKSNKITVEVSKETENRTNVSTLKPESLINLERALKLSSRLGGHIVLGHIDSTVKIINKFVKSTNFQKNVILTLELPKNLAKYVVEKGSVAVDGVSLTVSDVSKDSFNVVIIPHTLESTTLKYKQTSDLLNLEVDILAKYVEKMQKNEDSYKNRNDIFYKNNFGNGNKVSNEKRVIPDDKLLKTLKENGFM